MKIWNWFECVRFWTEAGMPRDMAFLAADEWEERHRQVDDREYKKIAAYRVPTSEGGDSG